MSVILSGVLLKIIPHNFKVTSNFENLAKNNGQIEFKFFLMTGKILILN